MNWEFQGWDVVATSLRKLADTAAAERSIELNEGQAASLHRLAERLPDNGMIIADEVGMGKTRIAAAVTHSVIAAGGRVAILVPPGLGYQWNDELKKKANVSAPPILRSLWQYFEAWKGGNKAAAWFKESALIVSHAFTNWRLGEGAAAWRWALLPEVYARWRKHQKNGRWPRDYCNGAYAGNSEPSTWVSSAAEQIVNTIAAAGEILPAYRLIKELAEATPWPDALDAGEYGRGEQLRPWLERAVGLGLGVFDLVIVDEAHKSRGSDSGLTRLLDQVVLKSPDARHLAMTATPVELEATQWTQMLERIQITDESCAKAREAINAYTESVTRVRQCPSDANSRKQFAIAAGQFKNALDDFLIRRDKREDSAVKRFQAISGEPYHAYRREQEVLIDTAELSMDWKQAVCAAEALSFVSRQSDQSQAKRLRLTLGNGHGIATLIDELHRDEQEDDMTSDTDPASEITTPEFVDGDPANAKRLLRAEWWQKVMMRPFVANPDAALFDHPAILAAVEEIESTCREEEKVLVFGRFTRPLRALVQLLNAREMLRCIDRNLPWPQSKVHENDNWHAIEAAHRQLARSVPLAREGLDAALKRQYDDLENQRERIREKLIRRIEEGLAHVDPKSRTRRLFKSFKKSVEAESAQTRSQENHTLAVVARAVQELLGDDAENASPTEIAQAFDELVAAASDRDEGDTDGNRKLDEGEADILWPTLKDRLLEEYSRSEGGYARLMHGATKPATRRFLQLAFNRKHGHPKVLVAQSKVGREGLNLHRACRTVVLLHPEWNPGVVEQQIGRVDRIGSLWEQKLDEAIANQTTNETLPKIQIRPVIFKGSYDEMNWQVLRERWDDLRAQLHGIVISPCIATKYPDANDLIAEINAAAPNFSPSAPSQITDST
jgi:superfamily II DNA or RNA helicase